MKTMLILIFLFTCFNLNAQVPASWNSKVQTYIPYVGSNIHTERVANFANHYGIHIIVQESNSTQVKISIKLKKAGQRCPPFYFLHE